MGRRVAHLYVREEMAYNAKCVTNFVAANAILMRIAARLEAQKALLHAANIDADLNAVISDVSSATITTDEGVH